MKRRVAIVSIALQLFFLTPALGFVHWAKWPSPSVQLFHEALPEPYRSAFGSSADDWNRQTTFTFIPQSGSFGACDNFENLQNGAEFSDFDCSGRLLPTTTFAVTDCIIINGTFEECGITFNDRLAWGVYDGPWDDFFPDFRRTALHELGHFLGLGHSDTCASIMGLCLSSFNLTSIQADDVAGVGALYTPHTLEITSGPSGIPDPVESAGNVFVSVSTEDSLGHTLSYVWGAVCPGLPSGGSFARKGTAGPLWVAPANATGSPQDCTISVTVADGFGRSDTGSHSQTVASSEDVPSCDPLCTLNLIGHDTLKAGKAKDTMGWQSLDMNSDGDWVVRDDLDNVYRGTYVSPAKSGRKFFASFDLASEEVLKNVIALRLGNRNLAVDFVKHPRLKISVNGKRTKGKLKGKTKFIVSGGRKGKQRWKFKFEP
jgi:hypothetical protein